MEPKRPDYTYKMTKSDVNAWSEFLRHLYYKPNIWLNVTDIPDDSGGYSPGPHVSVFFGTKNRIDGEPVTLMHSKPLPWIDAGDGLRHIYSMVCEMEIHEVHEHLTYDGSFVVQPHVNGKSILHWRELTDEQVKEVLSS